MNNNNLVNLNTPRNKKIIKIFFTPWIGPIWLKPSSIKRKNQSKWSKWIKYSVNSGKEYPILFRFTNYLESKDFQKLFINFSKNYWDILNELDFSHESFSIAKYYLNNPKALINDSMFPTYRSMMKQIDNDFKLLKYKYRSHLDMETYFRNIYLHSLTWNMNNEKPEKESKLNKLHDLYMHTIANSETYGIPISLHISTLMAEFNGYKITKILYDELSKLDPSIRIYRYIDDIFLVHNKILRKNKLEKINKSIYLKFEQRLHVSNNKTKCFLNKWTQHLKWSKNYNNVKKNYYSKNKDMFRNNITNILNRISLYFFNKKNGKILKRVPTKKELNKNFIFIEEFLNDKKILSIEKLSFLKTSVLLRLIGYPNSKAFKSKKYYHEKYLHFVNFLYKFYLKHFDELNSEDLNNFGILIYLEKLLFKDKFSISKTTLMKIQQILKNDENLLMLVSSLWYYLKENTVKFNELVRKTFYSEAISWSRIQLENKNNLKWLSIDTYSKYEIGEK